ncbi:MAG: glycosyltransferase family 4 protein [Thiohalomonadales bacterium]
MRIVNFISGGDLGGPKQSFLHYTEVLQNLNHDVYSLVRKGAPLRSLLKPITHKIVEVAYIRTNAPILRYFAAYRLRRIIAPLEPQLVIAHKQVDIALLRLALKDRCKIVGVIHGYNSKHIQYADALVAVSNRIKDFLISKGYKKPIYTIPNMVKLAKEEPETRSITNNPLIGTMGMFRRKKGMDVLVNALSILRDRGVSFNAVMAGGGYQEKKVKKLANDMELTDLVRFRPWLTNEEKWGFLDSLDIFCLPSRSESFGMVVIEAMARKKTVVATKCGGPEETIQHGINGFLVENDSPTSMANCISDIISNRDKYASVGENAYKTARDTYSLEVVEKLVRNMISDLFHLDENRT